MNTLSKVCAILACVILLSGFAFVFASLVVDGDLTRFRNDAVKSGHAEWISDPRDGHPVFHWKEVEK